MRDDILGFLGLMRRAGKLGTGEEGTRQAVHAGKATLILCAEDASENAKKRAADFAAHAGVPLVCLDEKKAVLAGAIGVAGGSMFAVCDAGFAKALQNKLQGSREE